MAFIGLCCIQNTLAIVCFAKPLLSLDDTGHAGQGPDFRPRPRLNPADGNKRSTRSGAVTRGCLPWSGSIPILRLDKVPWVPSSSPGGIEIWIHKARGSN